MTADDTAGEAPGHTTERIDPSYYLSSRADAFLYACHLATYDFAATFTEGRRVLDFGCGTGYGTHRIAPGCERIVGVDVSDEAIGEATRRFQASNLGYQRIAPAEEAPLPFDDDSFDLVLSFQVYEHLTDTGAYLREVARVLTDDGTFICVTPDRSSRLLPGQRPWNRYHVHEYSQAEMAEELRPFFDAVEVAGMSAGPELLHLETDRYRKLKWLTYPVTFPGVPERIRTGALRQLQRLERSRPKALSDAGSTTATLESFDVDPTQVDVFTTDSPSLNVVGIARRPR